MLEFVDSDLYFVQDENNFINPFLQVGSGGPKITGSSSLPVYNQLTLLSIIAKFLTSVP